jgi:hypothetical protein
MGRHIAHGATVQVSEERRRLVGLRASRVAATLQHVQIRPAITIEINGSRACTVALIGLHSEHGGIIPIAVLEFCAEFFGHVLPFQFVRHRRLRRRSSIHGC